MIDILLTCDYDDHDVSLDLKRSLQRQYGFNVMLHVDSDYTKEDVDAKIEEATLLLIFDLGESNISAWIVIKGLGNLCKSCEEEDNWFPESIDFSKSYSKGFRVFEDILHSDFGVNVTRRDIYSQQ